MGESLFGRPSLCIFHLFFLRLKLNPPLKTTRDPQYVARNSVVSVPDQDLGPVRMHNVFPVMSRTPGAIRRTGGSIDQDRDEILSELRLRGRLPALSTQEEGST